VSLSAEEIAFARELFADVPGLTTRRMFGGLGIYSDGAIFALMRSDGQILIKAPRGPFADRLADMGCTQWTYARKGGPETAMPYWTLPDSALDEPEEAASLARQALAALD
jgi:DNA transformation protein and related proteins